MRSKTPEADSENQFNKRGSSVSRHHSFTVGGLFNSMQHTWKIRDPPPLSKQLSDELLNSVCSHFVWLPKRQCSSSCKCSDVKQLPVDLSALIHCSNYFSLLMQYVNGRVLQLPSNQLPFLETGFQAFLSFANDSPFKVTDGNAMDLYMTADFFLCRELGAKVLQFLAERFKRDVHFALHLLMEIDGFWLPELERVAMEAVLSKFTKIFEATNSPEQWLKLSADLVHRILSHNALNCQSEEQVLAAAAGWLRANPGHQRAAARLSECIVLVFGGWGQRPAPIAVAGRVAAAATNQSAHDADNAANQQQQQVPQVQTATGTTGPQAACQVYNPRADCWLLRCPNSGSRSRTGHGLHRITSLGARVYSGCLLVDGVIYVIGGYDGQQALRAVWRYSLRQPELGWHIGSCLTHKRYYVSCAATETGAMYAIGGHSGEPEVSTAALPRPRHAELYDPDVDQWTLIGRMCHPRSGVALVAIGDAVYAVGGNDGEKRLRSIEKYRLSGLDNEWVEVGQMLQAKSNLSAVALDGGTRILSIGGWSDDGQPGVLATSETFCLCSGASKRTANCGFAASATSACVLRDHQTAQWLLQQL
uniref:BACK domain-containing protein n=1 Tax=Macrostomum lignano TaxID=282301 RepID=A0A1I8F4I7_9PLAT